MVKRIDAVQNYKTKTKDTERVFFFFKFNVEGHSLVTLTYTHCSSFPGCLVGKNPPASAGDTGDTDSTPGSGGSPGGGNSKPLQCCCLENPMDRGA